jgi:hypothetical protein
MPAPTIHCRGVNRGGTQNAVPVPVITTLLVVETQYRNAVAVDVGRQHHLSLECLPTA